MGWTASTGNYVANRRLSYQDVNTIKNNSIALASAVIAHPLGGSRSTGSASTSFTDVTEYDDVVLNGANLSGLTVQARIQRKTNSTGVAVTARVRNLTDTSDFTGTAHTSDTNWTEELVTITLTTAEKRYRLQIQAATTAAEVFAKGRVEIFATS